MPFLLSVWRTTRRDRMVLDALWSGPSSFMGPAFWKSPNTSSRSDPTDNDQVLGVHAQTSGERRRRLGGGGGGAGSCDRRRSLQGARTPVASARIACRRVAPGLCPSPDDISVLVASVTVTCMLCPNMRILAASAAPTSKDYIHIPTSIQFCRRTSTAGTR